MLTKHHRETHSLAWEELQVEGTTKMKRTRRYGIEMEDSISDVAILMVRSTEG